MDRNKIDTVTTGTPLGSRYFGLSNGVFCCIIRKSEPAQKERSSGADAGRR